MRGLMSINITIDAVASPNGLKLKIHREHRLIIQRPYGKRID